jgi:hypothetical protein
METTTEFHPGLMKAEGQAALAALLAIEPGVYRKADLATAMSEATGITKRWGAGILSRLCGVGLAPHLRLRVGRRCVTLVDIDPLAIGRRWPAWADEEWHEGVPKLVVERLEWVNGRPE